MMALHCGFEYKSPIASIFAFSGYPLKSTNFSNNKTTPVYIFHGEKDDIVSW